MKFSNICSSLLLAGVLSLFAACVEPIDVPYSTAMSRNLILYNQKGNVVLCADLGWPEGPLTPGRNFSGQWHSAWMSATVRDLWTLRPDNSASYHAEMAAENMSVDLSLGQADRNIYLVCTRVGNDFSGEWYVSTLHGVVDMGKFALRYDPPAA